MYIPIWAIVTLVTLVFIYLVIAQYQLLQVIKSIWIWLRMRVTAIYKAAAKVLKPIWIWLNIYGYSLWKRWYVPILTLIAFGVFGFAICYYLIDIAKTVHNLVGELVVLSSQKITPPSPDSPSGNDLSTVLKNLAQGSALLLGALVAAATLFFTLIKTWINERTTTAEEEGLITDRINAAVASLGAEKTKKVFVRGEETEQTAPNIEVRIGAILALERMAKKNADVHIQIMEILTAYIRENAPVKEEKHDRKPRQDIQLAFTVIGRRPEENIALERMHDFKLDLRNCRLDRIDGAHLNFANALFFRTSLQKVNLNHADLREANFRKAGLQGAYLINAKVKGAIFWDATLYDTKLSNAEIQDNNIFRGELRNTVVLNADLRNQKLWNFDPRNLNNFNHALLRGASFRKLDLTESAFLKSELAKVFGDGSVILPEHLKPAPDHWDEKRLDDEEFTKKWRAWQKTLPPIDD